MTEQRNFKTSGVGEDFDLHAVTNLDCQYEAVAASATNQPLGATGAIGDMLAGLLIIPATTAPGQVTIKDGSNAAIVVSFGGTVVDLKPFYVPLGIRSTSGAWQVTTGTNVSAIGIGNFT